MAAGLTIASADVNAEFNQAQSAFDITTGHDHSGSAAGTGAKIPMASAVSGTLPVANGGTGVTTSTGTGNNVLSISPTLTGTVTAGAITASGIIQTTVQANLFGQAAGSKTSPTSLNTNILLYKVSGTNYSGIGAHTDGAIYFVTGASAPATRVVIDSSGNVQFNTYTAGVLQTDGSGNISSSTVSLTASVSGTLPIANGGTGSTATTFCNLTTNVTGTLPVNKGGTGVTTSTGTGNTVLSASPTLTGTIVAAAINASANVGVAGSGAPIGIINLAITANNTGIQGGVSAMNLITGGTTRFAITDTAIQSNVNLGVGVPPSHQLQLQADDGFKPGGGSWGDSSDIRLKQDFVTEFEALNKLKQLKPTLFTWKENNSFGGGFIAQELAKVFPEFVSEYKASTKEAEIIGDNTVYGITLPFKFYAYLVKAIQELDKKIESK